MENEEQQERDKSKGVTVEEGRETVQSPQEREKGEKPSSRFGAVMREHFSAPRLAYMAVFTALAFAVSLLEFPIFPLADFLKLDFANVFFLFEGFIFGPVEAFVSIVIKELLSFAKSSSEGVGELTNLIMSTAFIIIPAIAYRFRRGKRWVCLYLVCGCVMQTGISLITNRYISFPFFMGAGAAATFRAVWYYVLAFNVIKSVAVSVIVFLIYKPVSKFIQKTCARFDKRMEAAKRRRKEAAEQRGQKNKK